MESQSWGEGLIAAQETTRVARLLDMIVRISTRPKMWTRRALAQAYEISERRVQADLEIIVHRLKLPLAHSRAGYYLTEARPLPAVTFAFGEAVALLLAASVGQDHSGVDSAELAAAFARMKNAFPPELRRLLDALERRPSTRIDDDRRRVLELLQESLATNVTVRMRYATASRGDVESERDVDPYRLVPYMRSFQLIGYCHTRRETRIFKVDRIQQLRLTGRRFDHPDSFDIEEYLGGSWGLVRTVGREPELVELLFTRQAGRWVSEEYWQPGQQLEWQDDGSLRFGLRLAVNPAFVRWVLHYGTDVEVIQPAWLAEAVAAEARAVVERHSKAH